MQRRDIKIYNKHLPLVQQNYMIPQIGTAIETSKVDGMDACVNSWFESHTRIEISYFKEVGL